MIEAEAVARKLKAENLREAEEVQRRRLAAQKAGRSLAERIVAEHPEVRRVWGFGSTFELWRNYRLTSDIDLAIEGGDTLEIMRLTEASDFPVDVVSLEECPAYFADAIRSAGLVLAEARA